MLAQVQLSPSYEHLTAPPDHSARTLAIVKDFFTWDACHDIRARSIKELWTVMNRVFSDQWIEDAAETLLLDVLRYTSFDASEEQQESRELCTALVFSGKPDILATVATTQDAALKDRALELWYSIAPHWALRIPVPSWQSTAAFLSVPLRCVTNRIELTMNDP